MNLKLNREQTLPGHFFAQAALKPSATAFLYCRPGEDRWVTMSWNRYREEVSLLAAWLQAQAVQKGDKIAILAANRPEWIISDLAILSIGAVTVPIYPNSSTGDGQYILDHSESSWLIIDKIERLQNLDISNLKGVIIFNPFEAQETRFTAYSSLMNDGAPKIKGPVALAREDIATIVYTSGTTGKPKGVVHTHRGLSEAMASSYEIIESPEGTVDRFFSFLPLSHVAERVLVEMGSISTGSEVAFARSVDTIGEDLPACQPTILLCVPRLWEKMQEGILAKIEKAQPIAKLVFKLAGFMGGSRVEGTRIEAAHYAGIFPLASDALVGKKLRERLGLARTRLFVTGSAPTRPDVQKFFASFGMPIREVYGLTENLCCGVLNFDEEIYVDSCGKPFPNNEMRLAEDGEIQFRAPWLFAGYYKNPEATKEVMTKDGWFLTGDLGRIDINGRLFIQGRKKELLKTSNGKYVAPVPIEDRIKANPMIQDGMIVGDSRKFCVALIALDPTGKEADVAAIRAWIDEVNRPLAGYEAVKKVGVLKEGFTIENGCLTPTLKLKRNFIVKAKEEFIERIYTAKEFLVFEA